MNYKNKKIITPFEFLKLSYVGNLTESKLKFYLQNFGDINHQNSERGYSALHLSNFNKNNIKIIKLLLKYGINLDLQNISKNTALMCSDNEKIVKLLLKHGANPNVENYNGDIKLMYVSYFNQINLIKILLKYGSNINHQNKYGETPLYKSILNNSISSIKLLLKHGANPNIQNINGDTCFLLVSFAKNKYLFDLLLKYGMNIHIKNYNNESILLNLLNRNEHESIRFLFKENYYQSKMMKIKKLNLSIKKFYNKI